MRYLAPYSPKWIEHMLFLHCGQDCKSDPTTRALLKRISKYAFKAYRYGMRDGKSGIDAINEVESEQQIKTLAFMHNDPVLMVNACRFVYKIYIAGYQTGKLERKRGG